MKTQQILSSGLALVATMASMTTAKPVEKRQSYQTHNLTPDGYWHNRYHMLLSMAAYGDYNNLCPNQTFTQQTLIQNFPNATRPPWTFINSFGPTPSGAEGFTAVVPEMNKALIIFKGNYQLEQTLPLDVVTFNELGLGHDCNNCTVNAYAAQGYYEAKNETNDWADIKQAYEGAGLVFSITGHGLGAMHSQIAGIDLYQEEIDYYNHAYGGPRTFNAAGAEYYHDRFDGEAGERGIASNDQYTEFIPESENYSHAGTPFYYWGFNHTSLGMNMRICWTEDDPDTSACAPRESGNITAEQSHYFYFSNVGQCGGDIHPDANIIDTFLSAQTAPGASSTSAALSVSSSSSALPSSSAAPPPPEPTTPAPAPSQSQEGSNAAASSIQISTSLVSVGVVMVALGLGTISNF